MSKKSNSFDIASKKMLKEKSLRAALVKYLIKGYQDKSFDQIKELLSDVTSSIDETVPHKRVGFDALFTVEDPVDKGKIGVFVNVETQGYKLKDEK